MNVFGSLQNANSDDPWRKAMTRTMSLGYLFCSHHVHIATHLSTLQKAFLLRLTFEFAPSLLLLCHVILRIRRNLRTMDGISLLTFGWSLKILSPLNI